VGRYIISVGLVAMIVYFFGVGSYASFTGQGDYKYPLVMGMLLSILTVQLMNSDRGK
jgi:hypothetical protein